LARDLLKDQKIASKLAPTKNVSPPWHRENQPFRTTFRFQSKDTSEKIPFACVHSIRGIVSAIAAKNSGRV
ncbi:hypothetical protein, partial [Pseudomonas helleri]|uniref:hypothetical protein n=1 Tax=Pseudomonas helleri TaxID=1608996 RepID=UPI00242B7A62